MSVTAIPVLGDDAEPGPRSPCTGVCELSADTGLCRGCLRTMDEIMSWPALGPAGKRRLLDQLARRRATDGEGAAAR